MEGYLTVVDVTEQQRLEDPFARLEKEEEDNVINDNVNKCKYEVEN